MNAQVSFGSQPQYRPHAASAQIAPQMIADGVEREGEGDDAVADLSSVCAAGSRAARLPIVPGR